MEIHNIPIMATENNKFQLQLNNKVYPMEIIDAAVYKFTGICYIYKDLNKEDNNILNLLFEAKENMSIDSSIPKRFCNELIDQQVRYNVNQQFGHIRDMIVEEAFKPVNF